MGEDKRIKRGLIVGLAGLALLGLGVFLLKAGEYESVVTISSTGDGISGIATAASEIWVDIEGEVIRPGVYRMTNGSRIEALIRTAGGFTERADELWVSKNINKAQLLLDGYKLYIPSVNEAITHVSKDNLQDNTISINSGTLAELESLPGIGPVTAKKIIDGRPYQNQEELIQRKIVGSKVWEQIKNLIRLW